MYSEQQDHFDVDVIAPGIFGRTLRLEFVRNRQLSTPRWRVYVAEDIPSASAGELAQLVQANTAELRRVADRLDDLAALLVTMRLVNLEVPPARSTEEGAEGRIWDITPEAIAGYGVDDFMTFSLEHVSIVHLAADCQTCALINARRSAV